MSPEHPGMTLEDAKQALHQAQSAETSALQFINWRWGSEERAIEQQKFHGDAVGDVSHLQKARRIRSEFEQMVERKKAEEV